MDNSYIQWNLPNWITIFLMVLLGSLLLNTGVAWYSSKFVKGS